MTEFLFCTLGAAATLIAQHIALWNHPWRLNPPIPYALGTLTLAFWFSVFCWLIGPQYLLFGVAFLLMAGIAGGAVIIAYWIRGRLDILKGRSRAAGRAEAVTNPYTQDIIDRGGNRGPDSPEPAYRKN